MIDISHMQKEAVTAAEALLSFLSEQRKHVSKQCLEKDASKAEMEQNIENLCGILRAHISKYVFIVSVCGGNGAADTANQLTEGIDLLVTSTRILRNKTSARFSNQLTQNVDNFLKQTQNLVKTLRDGGKADSITGMVWQHLDDIKEMKDNPLEDTWKTFENMQSRMKDVLEELKELRDNCIVVEGESEKEEVESAKDFDDLDALFDDSPEHLTKEGVNRVLLCISTINYFRKTFLDIYVWLKKGLKYNSDRHDEWLLSLVTRRKKFLRGLDMWGAALHEPQDPTEVEQESLECLSVFEDFIVTTNSMSSFSRRKFVKRVKGKKTAGTGKEWYSALQTYISDLRKQILSSCVSVEI